MYNINKYDKIILFLGKIKKNQTGGGNDLTSYYSDFPELLSLLDKYNMTGYVKNKTKVISRENIVVIANSLIQILENKKIQKEKESQIVLKKKEYQEAQKKLEILKKTQIEQKSKYGRELFQVITRNNQEITNIENNNEKLKKELDELKKEMDQLKKKNKELKKKENERAQIINNLQDEIKINEYIERQYYTNLEDENYEIEQKIILNNNEITILSDELDKQYTIIHSLGDEISTKEKQKHSENESITENNEEKKINKEDIINSLEEKISLLENIQLLDNKLKNDDELLNNAERKKEAMNIKIGDLEKEINDLNIKKKGNLKNLKNKNINKKNYINDRFGLVDL